MSNAKWHKLFAILRELNIRSLRWKLVRDDDDFMAPVPPESRLLPDRFGDVMPFPAVPFRYIEWVEVPAERSAGLVDALAAAEEFSVQQTPTGIRLVGYSWPVL